MSEKRSKQQRFWVLFVVTGERFPIRYMKTSDQYEVDLPAGVYGGEYLEDLKRELKADFEGVRITK